MRGGRRNSSATWMRGALHLVAAALIAAACGGQEQASAPTLAPTTTTALATPAAAAADTTAPTAPPDTQAPAAPAASATPEPGRLAGDARPDLSGAPGGQLGIAQTGAYRQPSDAYAGSLPIVIANNTSSVAVRAQVAATAAGGGQEFPAEDWGFHPNVIPPGGFAIGMVYFGNTTQFPPDTKTSFGLTQFAPSHYPFEIRHDLALEDVQRDGAKVTGVGRNTTELPLQELDVKVACFDTAGRILFVTVGNWSADSLAPGATSNFGVDFFDQECPTFLAGAVGYSE